MSYTEQMVAIRLGNPYGLHLSKMLDDYKDFDFFADGIPQHAVDMLVYGIVTAHAAGMASESVYATVMRTLALLKEMDDESSKSEGESGAE